MVRPVVSTERAPSPRALETAARKQRILDAVTDLAGEGGYDAVQMRDVASRAGVALGTLYRHYASKDQLLVAALAAQADALRQRLALRPAIGASPAARVEDALRRANRALDRRPLASTAMVSALLGTDPQTVATKLEAQAAFIGIIRAAIAADDFPDLDQVTRVLGHVWFSLLSLWASGVITTAEMSDELAHASRLLLAPLA